MKKLCEVCGASFEIAPEDEAFYGRMGLPLPRLAPAERMRRRMAWRNERCLYRRKCDATGKMLISIYSADKPLRVYDTEYWWSDKWNAFDFGRDFDFNRTFFENFADLLRAVPLPALSVNHSTMENSEYCNQCGYLKNCYLITNSDNSELCAYGKGVNRCYDCVDCFKVYDCEGCYECVNCHSCKYSKFIYDSVNCSECRFSANLIGCQNCLACVNLRNQSYCYRNQKLSQSEYAEVLKRMLREGSSQSALEEFYKLRDASYVKWMQETNTEGCSGDYLSNCRDCWQCFDCEELERSKYCSDLKKGSSISYSNYDVSYFGMGVIDCYDSSTVGYDSNRLFFCESIFGGSNQFYSILSKNRCDEVFGCISVDRARYCILNKQYAKQEYFDLKQRIIEHMCKSGEWGEFFPISLAPVCYNESVAQEYFPLDREEALARGYSWKDSDPKDYRSSSYRIPATIEEVRDDILDEILVCKGTSRNFRIQKSELDFYRRYKLPIPQFSPDVRHLRRLASRTPRKLFERRCDECGEELFSTVATSDPRAVLCLQDYYKALQKA